MRIQWSRYRLTVGVLVAACVAAVAALGSWRGVEPVEEGRRLVSEGAYIPATRMLARAVALSAGDARAHYYLGLAYAGIGQRGASLSHLEEAVRLSPTVPTFHDALGHAYRNVGDTRRALGEFAEAACRGSNVTRYEMELAGLLLDQGRWHEAAGHLRQVERADPRSPAVRLLLADALKRAGDREQMEREYREVMRLAEGTALGELARQQLHAAHAREP
jgi:Flp pilus assembly protein TadD